MYDVCVVGAGPSGSMVALKLGEKGWKVALIEKGEFAGKNNVCSGGVEEEIIKELNIPEEIIEKHNLGIEFKNLGEVLRKEKKISYVTVKREKYDNFLAKEAAKKCAYFTSTKIEKVEEKNSSWILKSKEKNFETKIIVFADGTSSKLRNDLEIGFKPGTKNFFVAMVREFNSKKTQDCFDIILDEKVSKVGYGWLFPRKDSVNIGLEFFSNTNTNSKKSMDYLVNYYYPEFSKEKPYREMAGIIPAEIAKKLVDEKGLIVVGDAGGFTSPLFGGGGLNFGLKSSFIATEIVDNALKKKNRKLLMDYEKELKKTSWFNLIKKQAILIKLLSLHPLFYRWFGEYIFLSGFYHFVLGISQRIPKLKAN